MSFVRPSITAAKIISRRETGQKDHLPPAGRQGRGRNRGN